MNIPNWLTKEFLENLLESNENNSSLKINIIKFEVVSALPNGNNYLSNVLRINIKYEDSASESIKEKSLIAKVPLQNGTLSQLNECGVNEKEFSAYVELLPKLNAIVKSKEKHIDLIPKMYKTDMEHTMILEDLAAEGYKMGDRKQQLDYEHAVVVLTTLARFHAASIKLHESEPKMVERIGTDKFFCKDMNDSVKEVLDPILGESHIDMVCEEFEKWPETRKFVEFLSKLKTKVWDVYIDCIYSDDDELVALNHGDSWTNNILFKYDENGKPKSLKFVDFQVLRFTSPTTDVLYFLYTSVRFEVLDKHLHDLTKCYLDSLNLHLKKYGTSKRLKEEDFKQSLEKREIFALLQCVNLLPFMFAEYTEEEENSKSKNEIPLKRFIQVEKFRSVCTKHLEKFSTKPWFQNFK